jgi:hypothetical protein
MLTRPILLVVATSIGLLGLPFVAFLSMLGVMGPGGAERGRGTAVFALFVCAAFLVWEVLEIISARRVAEPGMAKGRTALAVVALATTVLTTVGYVLLRIALR